MTINLETFQYILSELSRQPRPTGGIDFLGEISEHDKPYLRRLTKLPPHLIADLTTDFTALAQLHTTNPGNETAINTIILSIIDRLVTGDLSPLLKEAYPEARNFTTIARVITEIPMNLCRNS